MLINIQSKTGSKPLTIPFAVGAMADGESVVEFMTVTNDEQCKQTIIVLQLLRMKRRNRLKRIKLTTEACARTARDLELRLQANTVMLAAVWAATLPGIIRE